MTDGGTGKCEYKRWDGKRRRKTKRRRRRRRIHFYLKTWTVSFEWHSSNHRPQTTDHRPRCRGTGGIAELCWEFYLPGIVMQMLFVAFQLLKPTYILILENWLCDTIKHMLVNNSFGEEKWMGGLLWKRGHVTLRYHCLLRLAPVHVDGTRSGGWVGSLKVQMWLVEELKAVPQMNQEGEQVHRGQWEEVRASPIRTGS